MKYAYAYGGINFISYYLQYFMVYGILTIK